MYNRAIIMGRLTAAPELKQTPSNVPVCRFRVAVNRPYSKGGEKQADFFTVVAWRQTGEFIARYFTKGQAILVEGSMQSREYTAKDGQNRREWELVADRASFCGNASPDTAASTDGFEELDDDGDLPF